MTLFSLSASQRSTGSQTVPSESLFTYDWILIMTNDLQSIFPLWQRPKLWMVYFSFNKDQRYVIIRGQPSLVPDRTYLILIRMSTSLRTNQDLPEFLVLTPPNYMPDVRGGGGGRRLARRYAHCLSNFRRLGTNPAVDCYKISSSRIV